MSPRTARILLYLGIGVVAIAAPLVVPAVRTQLSFLWVMIVFALSWDILGGQMGYNSFGNILFFGIGMYTCAIIQQNSGLPYYPALFIGMLAGGLTSVAVAAIFGWGILGLRGHYFAIGTLGLGIAAAEYAAGWDYVGAGSGMVTPLYPGEVGARETFFYYVSFAVGAFTFLLLRALYQGRFRLAINAIRDDEDKAEAMGIHTTLYKIVAWCIAAFTLGLIGPVAGNMIGFIDPRDVAFASATFGVWMLLMAILGGKGTLWGPVIGATVFHIVQELFWTYLLGWQRVALGLMVVVIVIFFPMGIVGWVRERWPERFGHRVEEAPRAGGGGQ